MLLKFNLLLHGFLVQLDPVEAIEEVFEALVEVQWVGSVAVGAFLAIGALTDRLTVGPSWGVVKGPSLVNFPQAETQSSNFLRAPLFEFELFGRLFDFINTNLEYNIFENIDF